MEKVRKYGGFLLLLGFAWVTSVAQDYSKMSANELNAAFIVAVKKGSSDEVQKLLQAGANVNTPIPYTWTSGDCDWDIKSTALIYAVKHNLPSMVKVLLKGEKGLNEALNVAIKEGYSDVVEELIKGGVDINYVNENQDTPLIQAIQHARATAEFSLQAQARYNSRWSQRREIIQALLTAGAKVNHVNKYGRTALMLAVIEHDLHTVQNLLELPEITTGSWFGFGTKPINYVDQDGNTALMLALQHIRCSYINNQEYNICINSQEIIKALLAAPGIDLHHANKKGDTAIRLLKEIDK